MENEKYIRLSKLKSVLSCTTNSDIKWLYETYTDMATIQSKIFIIQESRYYDLGYHFHWEMGMPYSRELVNDVYDLFKNVDYYENDYSLYNIPKKKIKDVLFKTINFCAPKECDDYLPRWYLILSMFIFKDRYWKSSQIIMDDIRKNKFHRKYIQCAKEFIRDIFNKALIDVGDI